MRITTTAMSEIGNPRMAPCVVINIKSPITTSAAERTLFPMIDHLQSGSHLHGILRGATESPRPSTSQHTAGGPRTSPLGPVNQFRLVRFIIPIAPYIFDHLRWPERSFQAHSQPEGTPH